MEFLSLNDTDALLALIAKAVSPENPDSLQDRQEVMLVGLAKLCQADLVSLWSGRDQATEVITLRPVSYFSSATQPAMPFNDSFIDSPFTRAIGDSLRGLDSCGASTWGIADLVRRTPFVDQPIQIEGTDWQNSLFCVPQPNRESLFAIGLHRATAAPPFVHREQILLRMMATHLHRRRRLESDYAAASAMSQLTPRQRAVLAYLLQGKTQKEIAESLGLSAHTVGGHMKVLYKMFDVTSRGGLQAYFLQGSTED